MFNKKYLFLVFIFIGSCKKNLIPQTDIPIEVINNQDPLSINLADLDISDVNKYLSDLTAFNTSLMSNDPDSVPPEVCVSAAIMWASKHVYNRKIPIKELNSLNYAVNSGSAPNAIQCPNFSTKKVVEYAHSKYLNSSPSNGKGIIANPIEDYRIKLEKNNCFKNVANEFKDRVKIDNFTLNVFENSLTTMIPNIRIYYIGDKSITNDTFEGVNFEEEIKKYSNSIVLIAEMQQNLDFRFKGSVDLINTKDFTQERIQDLAVGDARIMLYFGPFVSKPYYFQEGDTSYYYLIEGKLKFSIGFKGSFNPSMGNDALDVAKCFLDEIKKEAKEEDRKRRDEYNKSRSER